MKKPTPNPPETEDTTSKNSRLEEMPRSHRTRPRPLPQSQRVNPALHKPSPMFQVAPEQDSESLLVHACESLAQASLMTSDIAAYIDLPQRRTISGDPASDHARRTGREARSG